MSSRIDKSKGIFYYRQFADLLRKQILNGRFKPGESIPSERQLSKEHRINRITIRRGLAQLIKEGLLYSVPGTGTFVSETSELLQAPRKQTGRISSRRKNISCLIRRLHPTTQSPILSPYYIGIFTMLQKEASRLGYGLSFNFITSIKDERETSRWALENNLDGIIIIGKMDRKAILSLYDKRFPLVLVDNYITKPALTSVIPDNKHGAYLAVRYLLNLGHKRIGFIRAPLDQPAAWERLEGYKQALEEDGIKYDENLVEEGYFLVEEGYRAAMKLLKRRPLPSAIFAVNDEAAIGTMKAIRENTDLNIPKDISIIGFDDIEWAAHTHPPLTTVKIFKEEMGAIAMRKIADAIEGRAKIPTKEVIPVELVIRGSCAKPKR